MSKKPLTFGPDALWVTLAAAFTGAASGQWPVRNYDFWWHVVMGRLLAATGQAPDKVYFLYTMDPQAPSYVQAWWSQWLFWQLQQLGGDSVIPVLLMRNVGLLIVALVSGLIAWRRAGSGLTAAMLVVMAGAFTTAYIDARSHLTVWPLFVPVWALAHAARAGKISPWAVTLVYPLVTVAWANLHGSFIIPSLIALAALGATLSDKLLDPARWRPRDAAALALTLPLCWLAPLAHPLGVGNYTYMRMMMQSESLRSVSSEWYMTTPFAPAMTGQLFYLILPALAVLAWRRHRSGKGVELFDLFLLAGFAIMSIKQCRDLMWFGFSLPLAAAPLLAGLIPPKPAYEGRAAAPYALASAAALAVALVCQPWNPAYRAIMPSLVQEKPVRDVEPERGVLLRATPVEAATLIQQHPAFSPDTTRIFCDHNYSGYLLYRLQQPAKPTPMVFTDHRYELITPEMWREYNILSDAAPGWDALLDRYDVSFVLASAIDQQALQAALDAHPGWTKLAQHIDHTLYVRSAAHAR